MLMNDGWMIFQDVHDRAETRGLPSQAIDANGCSELLSHWEMLPRLQHLQTVLSSHPYYGRELRHFNTAPWWYRRIFSLKTEGKRALMTFESIDYYCKIWINGQLVAEHEGYQEPIRIDITDQLQTEENVVLVKVWSPWDTEDICIDGRCFRVERNMIKGTYEHADGFVQRDVNPVGIYGDVTIELHDSSYFGSDIYLTTELSNDRTVGTVRVEAPVQSFEDGVYFVGRLYDAMQHLVTEASCAVPCGNSTQVLELHVDNPSLWTCWDRGRPYGYTCELTLLHNENIMDERCLFVGIRSLHLERDANTTRLWINGEPLFLRGTSYFPDVYISTMHRERYARDLMLIKQAGFNAIRVHVHVERQVFYDLCDEMGILVFQDSDFNWNHPLEEAWIEKAQRVYASEIRTLRSHPSIVCWIVLNEPVDSTMSQKLGLSLKRILDVLDPGRPIILSSQVADDPLSGDSHNYRGSLSGEQTQYTDIDGSTEKLNTEFGVDVPGAPGTLFRERRVYEKLAPILGDFPEMQRYQYNLLKYYIEHYRFQKYKPCAGYFQFMFIDLCPQSYYGVLDWWGVLKPGFKALLESNQPVAVMVKRTGAMLSLVAVNDTPNTLIGTLCYTVRQGISILASGKYEMELGPDSVVTVLDILEVDAAPLEITLEFVSLNGSLLSRNYYAAFGNSIRHIAGHPSRFDNEIGTRTYALGL